MRRILLLAALLFAQPVHAQVWGWSQTATSNATIDNTINWAEGMPSSAVNDSARAMMARIAAWHADFAGNILDTGTSSAYAVATASGAVTPTPVNNTRIVFRPANTNVAGVTLAADAGTAYPIQGPLGTAIPQGIMQAGVPYAVVFNTGGSAWVLEGYMNTGLLYPARITADISFTSNTTLTNLAGFSFPVVNGQSYYYNVDLYSTGGNNGGTNIAFNCTCTTSYFIESETYIDIDSTVLNCTNVSTNLTHSFTCGGSGSDGLNHATGSFTASSSGTFTLQGAQHTSSGTPTVYRKGSVMTVGIVQ